MSGEPTVVWDPARRGVLRFIEWEGERSAVASPALRDLGWVDKAGPDGTDLVITGWSLNLRTGALPKALLLFLNDRRVEDQQELIARPDLRLWPEVDRGGTSRAGFRIVVPLHRLLEGPAEQRVLRVVAVFADGVAVQLLRHEIDPQTPSADWLAAQALPLCNSAPAL